MSSVGRDRDTVGPLPPPMMPSWGMPYAPARPYAPSYLSPANAGPLNYGLPATPYNYVNDSVSYVSMPGMNGAESVASGMIVSVYCLMRMRMVMTIVIFFTLNTSI